MCPCKFKAARERAMREALKRLKEERNKLKINK